MQKLWFIVNGEARQLEVAPGEMLSDTLRYQLGLTGTKVACQEAECGACTVLLNGEPVLSCALPAMKANGKEVLTIEGLSHGSRLHPLQDAFILYGAVQCGFCTPGQIMAAYALLARNPDPSDVEIRAALKDTLCRCGAYASILRAVKAAARSVRAGIHVEGMNGPTEGDISLVGKLAPRPDALDKVTGRGKFTDDYSFPNMLHARVLRAGIPHGIVKRLDVSRARALEGVRAVLTANDVPGERNHGLLIKDWPVLVGVGEKVRYVGDAVAIVAAETRDTATQALDLIEVEYEELPVVSDPVEAHRADAVSVHENGNLLKKIEVNKGDVLRGFSESDLVFEETYHTPTMDHVFMEPECSIARVTENGRIEIYVGSQVPYADREQVAASLGVAESRIRVIGTLVGGGFGGKEDIAGQIHSALLAWTTGRPVKLLYDRHESLIAHPKRHATRITVRLGAKQDGTLLASKTELYGDTGAYASLGEHVMTRATTHSTGPYVVPNVMAQCYAMYTNNPPSGAFRGFGALQSAFAIESMMDELAEKLGMNPVELRLKNALRAGTVTNTGQLLAESVGLVECIQKVNEEMLRQCSGADPFQPRSVPGCPSMRRAWGFATAFKNTGIGGGAADKAAAEVELYTDGSVEVRTSSAEIGQGLVTVLQMIAAEELGIPLVRVRVLLSDTDLTPDGGPTTGSRQTYVTGNAVRHAAVSLREAMTSILAEKYDCPPALILYERGKAKVNGRDVSLEDVAAMMKRERREPRVRYEYLAPATAPLGTSGDIHFAFSFAAQAAEVDVNLDTGEVRVLRVIAATDVGKAINPLGLIAQIEGGVVMGLGHALTEEFILEQGRIFTDRLARYRMPSMTQMPEIIPIVVEHPTREGPYGAKGVGEISTMATPPAITNAVYRACGVRMRKLPVDQDWLALQLAARDK
ncbi:MAG: molybdopterin cofactor-binding domain-containing protein [Anaerolineales bacterium]|jgi:xanthine dehydrogenase molybdenum-binding subunit